MNTPLQAVTRARHWLSATSREASILVSSCPADIPHLPLRFLPGNYRSLTQDQLQNLRSLVSVSLCIGDGFHPERDIATLEVVLSHITQCVSITDTFVYFLSRTWPQTSSLSLWILEFIKMMNPPDYFRLYISTSTTVRTEVLLQGGRVSTGAGLPMDIVSDAYLLHFAELPGLQWLELHQPLQLPVHHYNQRSTFEALKRHLHRFRSLNRVTLSMLLGGGLADIIPVISASTQCSDLKFVDLDLVEVQDQANVIQALRGGLLRFSRPCTVVLPGEANRRSLRDALMALDSFLHRHHA
ncbi:hypothetical protein Moror_8137 [Moniliophthora roreri MCA 2997]|uniref:Uncharacterized protein n=1 Tax=Moniliophthora roreri (strain MCA 2997) TaxID=1381753 RepID=V2YS31_MONRO|nr:hypothetical protein Moror_8137 [Moniliophthora roreri MCA 2997]